MNKCQVNVIFRFLFIQPFSKNLKFRYCNTAMLSKSVSQRTDLIHFQHVLQLVSRTPFLLYGWLAISILILPINFWTYVSSKINRSPRDLFIFLVRWNVTVFLPIINQRNPSLNSQGTLKTFFLIRWYVLWYV